MSTLDRSREKMLRQMAADGWQLHRLYGSGHVMVRRETGVVATIAHTPRDCRSRRNEAALLLRLVRQTGEARA